MIQSSTGCIRFSTAFRISYFAVQSWKKYNWRTLSCGCWNTERSRWFFFFFFLLLLSLIVNIWINVVTKHDVDVSLRVLPQASLLLSCVCFILSHFTIFIGIVASSVLPNHISIFTLTHRTENLLSSFSIFASGFYLVLSVNRKCNYDTNRIS